MNIEHIWKIDPEVAELMDKEKERQERNIELIASENFVSEAVLEAQGSVLTNKYAEGYPGKKYYGGCEYIEQIETIAIERAKELFGAEHVNVQPHSGSQANMAVYFSVLEPGDTILAMNLAHGGHLSHGSPVNFSGKFYKVIPYGVTKDTGRIDYDEVRRLALENKPKLIVTGASAYPREIDFEAFSSIAKEVGAYLMADIAHIAGLVVAGEHQSPVPYADFVTTTTHKTLRGPRGAIVITRSEYQKLIDKTVFPGIQGGPLMHVIAAKAVAFKEAQTEEFKQYQKQIVKNAKALAESLKKRGFDLVSNGTDNHLLLLDLRSKNITGKEAEALLESVHITVNKNAIPFDPQKPMITSGIRIGTPAITTRGMKEEEMDKIAECIDLTLTHKGDEGVYSKVRNMVKELTDKFPLYK